MRVFLLGMGIVNPLGTAQALSPFGEKAGAASALLGFWQMMVAAIGVWLAATISHEAMFALGIVLTAPRWSRSDYTRCGPKLDEMRHVLSQEADFEGGSPMLD